MSISIKQIRAARVLLGWSQKKLAEKAGVSLPAINTLERGVVSTRHNTFETVQTALEKGGVEFLPHGGLREKTEILDIQMHEGENALAILFNDIWSVMGQSGGILRAGGIEEERFLKVDRESLLKFAGKAVKQGKIKVQLLIEEEDDYFIGDINKVSYHWFPKEYFSFVPHYIYGDKHAVVLWGPPLRIIITHNKTLADANRKQFDINWSNAKEPPPHINHRREIPK